MSSQYHNVEQDQSPPPPGDDLPTYDDLAAQNGPNSRFGRWRGWIEKRAAERYADSSPGERARRRERGWDFDDRNAQDSPVDAQLASATESLHIYQDSPIPYDSLTPRNAHFAQPPQGPATPALSLRTDLRVPPPPPLPPRQNDASTGVERPGPGPESPLPPLPFVSQKLPPSHLRLNHFGSRFLPHSTAPIRCLLPLPSNRLLLIGHDEGLSVLEMFPHEWTQSGNVTVRGPEEAQARLIWRGESVFQMTVLEMDNSSDSTPQGVVLALVGPEAGSPSGKEQEGMRTLRMYNLASLTSLAKWAVSQKGARPLDLHRPSNWNVQQTPTKRHRPSSSIARSIKSFIDNPHGHSQNASEPSSSSYHRLLSPSPSASAVISSGRTSPVNPSAAPQNGHSTRLQPQRADSTDGWDVVEDLPLRWATDFVPLASQGSRLVGTSVISYALWSEDKLDKRTGRNAGGRLLAVATKSNIFLYETPRGERAFHFVKEFYTPLQPRGITFFHQTVQDVPRHFDLGTPSRYDNPARSDSTGTASGRDRRASSQLPNGGQSTLTYDNQLSLFVIFDKKAGWIRLADAAVGEMELYDDGTMSSSSVRSRDSLLSSPSIRRPWSNNEGIFSSSAKWILPTRCELPLPTAQPGHWPTQSVYLFTRGRQTQILPCPLPVGSAAGAPPLRTLTWRGPPSNVTPRVSNPAALGFDDIQPCLQLVAMGEYGLEVQEISLSFLTAGKGKGKGKASAPQQDVVWAEDDTTGETGFLCTGGHWDHPRFFDAFSGLSYGIGPGYQQPGAAALARSYSASSAMTGVSFESLASEDVAQRMKQDEGIYGWCKKGLEDYRVFWVGGSLMEDFEEDPDC
ncbi:hypothetical protein HGRIS_010094 [Hohenbuehelia grisea]|uniref:Uncharacterized protein n=1 Tax=Hohenbuehelia grisea TaxID=104357 RepID=A0ABR3J3M0_9AGAR